MGRKFKLRNNAIVEEITRHNTVYGGGFQDDYKVIDRGDIDEDDRQLKDITRWLCLLLPDDTEFPTGGSFGNEFDIVSELD